jgi:hypothetical protein
MVGVCQFPRAVDHVRGRGAGDMLAPSRQRWRRPTGDPVRTAIRVIASAAVAAIGLGLLAAPADAKGGPVGGSGDRYFLNDSFTGMANTVFTYGDHSDEVYVGDWDGNGTDTLMIRRGFTFYARNSNTSGNSDTVFSYGNPGDVVLAGDWDGNGTDTLAVRRGNTYLVKNSVTSGVADSSFVYGDPGDAVLVGDWDGNRGDTLAVRRGGTYFIKNTLTSGFSDSVLLYGDPGDTVIVGHWSAGQSGDSLGVRRGNTYLLRNSLTSGTADTVFAYGEVSDTAFVGDWNGDRISSLGVRRAVGTQPPPPQPYYDNCTDVWNSIGRPLNRGEPGYETPRLDREGDGVACEIDPR